MSGAPRPPAVLENLEGRARPVIESVEPDSKTGIPAKATCGDDLVIEADVLIDGHDELHCDVLLEMPGSGKVRVPMQAIGNDRFRAVVPVEAQGPGRFWVWATVDRIGTWERALQARAAAGQDLEQDLLEGALLFEMAARRASQSSTNTTSGVDANLLERAGHALRVSGELWRRSKRSDQWGEVLTPEVLEAARRHPDPGPAAVAGPFEIWADRQRALFSTWYELFARSASPEPSRPGTLRDVIGLLGYIKRMGFDVLYLPPIHPIGFTGRKGVNGSTTAKPGDPGSPWAIGSPAGGHESIHPELGTMEDFDELVDEAAALGIEVALDLAWQCSPDHPWVSEHPEWFRRRSDGSIHHAENPPKVYEDVYPFDFETEDWPKLWQALAGVVEHWIGHGVRIFRVDNPHTKPLRFWRWLLQEVRSRHPEVVFLAEAFTRPRIMEHLAKIGFHQSYTYFTWRNSREELESYLKELTSFPKLSWFRPNLWPNTPDILHETLQRGGRPAFITRLVLAATMSASYGIFGPAYELCENIAREPGSEEYLHSDKYEVRHRDLDDPASIAPLISQVNEMRSRYLALQQNRTLYFHGSDNPEIIVYSKTPASPRRDSGSSPATVLVVVNLDWRNVQSGWVHLDLDALGLGAADVAFRVIDQLTGNSYVWEGPDNWVCLDPAVLPVHLFEVAPQR